MNYRPLYLVLTVLAFAACSSDEGTESTTAIDTTTSEPVESTSIPSRHDLLDVDRPPRRM